jgi:hypothetical protein
VDIETFCVYCRQTKPREQFPEGVRRYESGQVVPCDDCLGLQIRCARYGLTTFDYFKMLAEQDNSCAICHTPFTEMPLIDHCHTNLHVRGLLCLRCNSGLGMFKDSPDIIESALFYVKRNKTLRKSYMKKSKKKLSV